MRLHFLFKYKKLVLPGLLLFGLLILYIIAGEMLARSWETVVQGEHVNGRHILATVIWLLGGVILNIAIDMFLWEGVVRQRTGSPVPKLLKSTASGIVILLIVILVMSLVYHKSITGLLATAGGGVFVLGLALKSMIENAIQGIALNLEQIFKTGDIISIPGKYEELAVVKDITMRNTYLEDFIGHTIAIPNSVITSNVIRNFSRSKARTYSVNFSILLGVRGLLIIDAIRILNAAVATCDFVVQEPPPQVLISDIQSIQVKYDVSCWVHREKIAPDVAKHILYTKIVEQLASAGFEVGSPSIDFDDIEKRLAVTLRQVDRFSRLNLQEKEQFYQHEMADKRPLAILNKVSIFANLNVTELEELSMNIRSILFKSGDTLIRQGDPGDLMYILVEGALQVYIKSAGEELIPVAKLSSGKYFGEMSLLVGDPRSATITAITDCLTYEITKETMSNLFDKHPDMIEKISEKIADNQMMNLQKQKEFSEKDAHAHKRNFAGDLMKRITSFFSKKKPPTA